jgi:hypothetical protein
MTTYTHLHMSGRIRDLRMRSYHAVDLYAS